ncbi:uncharacterized protein LOC143913533 [Arctopsyche grandis]|uniref:uncharacterized protein LOC143913533 n=1 Tax=Arctopsyche grandis TaxID=121162 RepID=UPI00406D9667
MSVVVEVDGGAEGVALANGGANANGPCRLCTRPGALIPIFTATGDVTLSAQAMSCAHIQVQPGDGLPDRVCQECSFQLNASYRFKLQCEDSDRCFRSYLTVKSKRNNSSYNFTLKLENVSDNEDDKEKLTEILNDDSMQSYTPLMDADDHFDDTEVESKECKNLKTEPIDGNNFSDKVLSESNLIDYKESKHDCNKLNKPNKNHQIDTSELLDVDVDVYNHIRVKLTNKDKIWAPVEGCNHEALTADEKEMTDDKAIVLCHLCGKKYNKLSSNRQCRPSPFNSKGRKLRRDIWNRKLQKLEGLKWVKLKKKVAEINKDTQDTSAKRYMCDVCGQTYRQRNVLLQHQNTHTDVKSYSCSVCGKRFTRSSHVVAHMRIHNNIKPYVCETCGRSFTKSSDLCRHKRVHSDVRNYACPICGRRFKRSGDITSHMRSHTGDRPYSCSKCNKSYSSHSSLQKHKKTHCRSKLKHSFEDEDAKSKLSIQI